MSDLITATVFILVGVRPASLQVVLTVIAVATSAELGVEALRRDATQRVAQAWTVNAEGASERRATPQNALYSQLLMMNCWSSSLVGLLHQGVAVTKVATGPSVKSNRLVIYIHVGPVSMEM